MRSQPRLTTTKLTPLSTRFAHALLFAAQVHRNQDRKKSGIPYLSHLMGVAAIVLDYGGDEDMGIAALLHDAAEDHGGKAMLRAIEQMFCNHSTSTCTAASPGQSVDIGVQSGPMVFRLDNVSTGTSFVATSSNISVSGGTTSNGVTTFTTATLTLSGTVTAGQLWDVLLDGVDYRYVATGTEL